MSMGVFTEDCVFMLLFQFDFYRLILPLSGNAARGANPGGDYRALALLPIEWRDPTAGITGYTRKGLSAALLNPIARSRTCLTNPTLCYPHNH